MNKYCVSLNTAKALKQAGFPQENSSRYYCGGHTMYFEDQENGKFEDCENTDLLQEDEYCHTAGLVCDFFLAAPIAEEILKELPARLQFKRKVKKNPDWRIEYIPEDELEELKHAGYLNIANPQRWCVNYLSNACFGIQNMAEVFYDDTNLANAAAKAWLYLKLNNRI